MLQSAQATTASAARILPSGPSDASLPQPNGIAAMDEDDDMSVPRPSSSRPASAGQGRASSRPPTAPESARGRQATLGEAFGRSGRSTQQVQFFLKVFQQLHQCCKTKKVKASQKTWVAERNMPPLTAWSDSHAVGPDRPHKEHGSVHECPHMFVGISPK